MKRLFLLVLISLSIYSSYGQNDPTEGLIPPSPNAAALAKYGNFPVSTYTGVADISIPIYTISSNDITIPISISYHTGGITVAEEASEVGLGWALNAGGAITQTIRDKDDWKAGGFGQGVNIPPVSISGSQGSIGDFLGNVGGTSQTVCENYDGIFGGITDAASDMYNFNFLGYSGKFILDRDGTPVLIKQESIIFEKGNQINAGNNNEGWTATTPDGYRCYFGAKEEIFPQNLAEAISRTFYLSEIISPLGEVITFNYTSGGVIDNFPTFSNNQIFCNSSYPGCSTSDGSVTYNESYTELNNPQYLSSIDYEYGRISFNRESRDDVADGNKLKSIEIFGVNNFKIKEVELFHSYFEADTQYSHPLNGLGSVASNQNSLRLRLDSLIEKNGALELPPYTFEYNNTPFPLKSSFAQDYWGYFNGVIDNEHLIPDFKDFYYDIIWNDDFEDYQGNSGYSWLFNYEGADRTANETFMKAGVLEKVNYPSGGFTSLDYEAHRYGNFGNLLYNHNTVQTGYEELTATDINYGNVDEPWQKIEIPYTTVVEINIDINCPNPFHCGVYQDDVNPFVSIWEGYPGQLNSAMIQRWSYQDTDVDPFTGEPTGVRRVYMQLEPGTYWIHAFYPDHMPGLSEPNFVGGVTIKAGFATFEEVTEKLAGGLRVKQITDDGGVNSSAVTKTYNYEKIIWDGSSRTQGKLMSPPMFFRTVSRLYGLYTQTFPDCIINIDRRVFLSSTSFIPLARSAGGSYIGYDEVEVVYNGNGKSTFAYHNIEDANQYYPNRLSGIPTTPNLRNGLLREQKDFNEQGEIVRSVENEYESFNYSFYIGIVPEIDYVGCGNVAGPHSRCFIHYYLEGSDRIELVETTETLDGVTKTTNYEYDLSGVHRNPIESRFTNSDGKEYKTKYIYPNAVYWDINGPELAAKDQMLLRNIVNTPLRVESYVAGALVGGSWTEYGLFPGNSNVNQLILPRNIYSYEGSWDNKEFAITSYTHKGKPRIVTKEGWAPEQYVWQENLLKEKTFNYLGQEQWTQSWDWYYDTHRQLRSQTAIDGQITSYGYDDLIRSNAISARNGLVTNAISYEIGIPEGNRIKNITSFGDSPDRITDQYFDGLGRFLKSEGIGYDPNGHNVVFDAASYDGRGRNTAESYMINTFSTLQYQKNPLDRLERKINPDQNYKELLYECNTAADYIEVDGHIYAPCELFKHTVFDENGNPTTTFIDKAGRTIAVRDAIDGMTTYTYEDDGDLIVVASPAGAFTYTYDEHHRVFSKSIPGGGMTVFTSYDDRDLLLASSDANGNSTTNSYNVYGQLTQSQTGNQIVESEYEFDRITEVTASTINPDGSLGGNTTQSYSYDGFGRVINQTSSALAGTDTYTFEYNAADNLLESTRQHGGAHEFKMEDKYFYDHSGRLTQSWQKIGNEPSRLLNQNAYSHRDELTSKSLYSKNGGASFLQGVGYGYNVMGWLETINGVRMPEVDGKLPDCGLPGGPNAFPQIDTEVNLETLLEIINNGDQVIIGNDPCEDDPDAPCDGCPQDCIPDCSPEIIRQQEDYIVQYLDRLATTFGDFDLPSNLHLVEFCDGTTLYLLENELAEVPGEVSILNTTLLNHRGNYEIYCEGESQYVSVGNLFFYRSTCEEFLISGGNCEVIETTEEKDCSYEIKLLNFQNRTEQNTRNIIVSYIEQITETCMVNGQPVRNIILEEERTRKFTSNRFRRLTNGSLATENPNEPGQQHPSIQEGGYIETMNVSTFNPDGGLKIILDPNLVEQTYPNLPSDFNKEDLIFQSSTSTFVIRDAIKTVVKAALEQWADQYPFDYSDILYDLDITVNSTALTNSTRQYHFDIRFSEFHVMGKPAISLCDTKANLTYLADTRKETRHTVYPTESLNSSMLARLYDAEETPCGQVSIKYDLFIDYRGDCGSLIGELRYELTENSDLPELAYYPIVNCRHEVVNHILECGPTISVCNQYGCFGCSTTDNTPVVTTNPEIDPCNPSPPQCTPEQTAQQANQMADIMNQMANIDVDDLTLPVSLVQIMLCDGTMVWVLEDLLNDLTTYTWIQTVTITTTTEVFTVTIFPENDLFGMKLNYYDGSDELQAEPYKNGNVSWMKWKVGNQAQQQYGFRYDELDRIKNAYYQAQYLQPFTTAPSPGTPGSQGLSIETIHQNRYNLFNVGYDGAGNISSLSRNGFIDCQQGLIDDLNYSEYDGNQLMRVADSGLPQHGFKNYLSVYDYDANGNLIKDTGKKINEIQYNFLNLPRQIKTAEGDLKLWYDATGAKQRKEVTGAGGYTKEYVNGVEYKDGELEAIYTGDGRIIYEPATADEDGNLIPERYRYEFTLSDHLGNARVTFSDLDDDGFITLADNPETEDVEEPVEMLQENHYYPFGMNMEGGWSPQVGAKNQYQFNGSVISLGKGGSPTKKSKVAANLGMEYAEEFGLNVNMAAIRTYDPAIGRFWQVDPFAEEFYSWTPYKFGMDNPVLYGDPNGDCEWCKEALYATGAYIAGGANALVSNMTGDAPGTRGNPADFGEYAEYAAMGQNAGDIVSIGVGAIEQGLGFVATGAGILAAPETGGLSLTVSAAGTAGMAHGSMTTAAGWNNLVKSNNIDKPPRGRGAVSKTQRDKKRVWTKGERQKKLDSQGGKCAQCDESKTVDQTNGHHIDRHADGGQTNDANHAEVCHDCHKKLHSKDD